ncbi:ABC transporter ATP-binding protein [Isoptericola sp. b441]|uniref:ABC transporter ATP-binding protein n=1 Tax=Actinotalea lenta TaxID=3064654 RepID=A0ABT9D6N5_9CELL|nr:ABC transporter ATP-binding protein [Isoptericola sp. b441]MDO8106041.1 ABC transporter ATP-binding protein [Isoptericola sp. b441]
MVLEVVGLRKRYGDVVALDGLDLDVAAGEVVGLVGHNGAGKTTAMDVITGLVVPDAGKVRVTGVDALAAPRRARAMMGVAAQELQLYATATVRQNLSLCAGLAGIRAGRRARAITEVLDELGLSELAGRPVMTLSGGQRRRAQAACALVGDPALLLLDEPTVGADPQTRAALLAAVRRRADAGAAVLYTTHYLPELVELDASLAVMRAGRVVARDSQAALLAGLPSRLVVRFADGGADGPRVIRTQDPGTTLAELASAGRRLRSIDVQHATLDDLIVALGQGEEVRDAA